MKRKIEVLGDGEEKKLWKAVSPQNMDQIEYFLFSKINNYWICV